MTYPAMSRVRFTVRELFLLTVIAALGLAWWVDYRRPVPQVLPTPPAQVGRWEVVIGRDGLEILLDTATGDTRALAN